ncbi:MAG: zinc ribbon domain-containing protein [Anaerolineae bacterium]|nr:zinc ribbon domain-containing protein [Anaerolineae bacterium]
MSDSALEHHCLPRPGRACPQCGEIIPPPTFCERCGADISPPHTCTPRPLPHVCPTSPSPGRCMACGEELPALRFCSTCGADITPSHRCAAAPSTHVHRADPVHICPSLPLGRCDKCGELLPALCFCENCGGEITPPHHCLPVDEPHVCPPYLLIPHRCSHCGEELPALRFCAQCGADNITSEHICKQA